MRIVCVFAHQDDEMRCLGTLQRFRETGHEISFVCVTQGDKGLAFDPSADRGLAASVRDAEMRSVAASFAADYRCLGREDGFLYDDAALRRDLIRTLREQRAELVFTHWTSDYNSDHVVTARAVLDAALFTSLSSFEPASPPLERVPRIFHVHPGDGYGFEATHFVQLTPAHVTVKAELIRRHRSQMDVMRRLRGRDYADEIADEDRRQGARLMVAHAEAFRACLAERRIPWPSDLPSAIPDQVRDQV
ncbi:MULTISPECIES: PIG-L deacetylase family protein [unclassified Frankia]|nr:MULTISPECIES: PIG-L family deacetylase [unclassified Frankia]